MKTCFCHLLSLFITTFLIATQLCAAPLIWRPGPNLPAPRSHAAAVMNLDGSVAVTGGATSVSPLLHLGLATASTSSISATAWSYGGIPLDTTHVAPGVGILSSGQVFIFGGHEGNQVSLATSGSFYLYYISDAGDFVDLESMSTGRSYHGYAADKDGNIFTFGGLDAKGNVLDSAERFANSFDVPAGSIWTGIAPMPEPLFGLSAVFDGNDGIYVFGGSNINNSSSVSSNVYRYSVSTNIWTRMSPMPVATRESAAVRGLNGKIYVMGGLSASGVTAEVLVYDTATNSWNMDTPLPLPVYGAAAVLDAQTRLMLIGGKNSGGNTVDAVWTSQRLDQPDAPPVITSAPVTTASLGTAYSYTVKATGAPLPTFTLSSAPAGMTIDTYSGTITWTPIAGQSGAQAVVVQASNAVGAVTQSFTISVSGTAPDVTPPSVPTGVTATSITKTGFNLNWSASIDNVGVTGYRVYLNTRCGFKFLQICPILQQTVNTTSATISGLVANGRYTYAVSAIDAAGNASASSAVAVTTLIQPGIWHSACPIAAMVGDQLRAICPSLNYGRNFIVQTSGNPKPTLSIVSGPPGMSVDSNTGVVTWKPVVGTPGIYTATVRATNSEGSADLNFDYTIYVAGTDLYAPSDPGLVTVANVTQTSVTINWSGATDNVSVTSYNVIALSGCRLCVTSSRNVTVDGSTRSIILTGLLPNRYYTITVSAGDAVGHKGANGTLLGGVRTRP